jgi:hypothetical protein
LIGIFIFLISHFVFTSGLTTSFNAIFIGLILLMPVITRFARNIYINMFVNYDSRLKS